MKTQNHFRLWLLIGFFIGFGALTSSCSDSNSGDGTQNNSLNAVPPGNEDPEVGTPKDGDTTTPTSALTSGQSQNTYYQIEQSNVDNECTFLNPFEFRRDGNEAVFREEGEEVRVTLQANGSGVWINDISAGDEHYNCYLGIMEDDHIISATCYNTSGETEQSCQATFLRDQDAEGQLLSTEFKTVEESTTCENFASSFTLEILGNRAYLTPEGGTRAEEVLSGFMAFRFNNNTGYGSIVDQSFAGYIQTGISTRCTFVMTRTSTNSVTAPPVTDPESEDDGFRYIGEDGEWHECTESMMNWYYPCLIQKDNK